MPLWIPLLLLTVSIGMIVVGMRQEGFATQGQGQAHFQFVRNQQAYATVALEIAETPEALQQGLMYRTSLAPSTGMLFRFQEEAPRSFWMRNTLISLDMLFLTANGTIITIHEKTQTQSDQSYSSTQPAQYGMELPAGTVQALGIRLGDRVQAL